MQQATYQQYRKQTKQQPRVMAIGTFDGVHYGHRQLIDAARQRAEQLHGELVVLTFWPPPALFLDEGRKPQLLTTRKEKAVLLSETGVDTLITAEFNDKLAHLSPADFCRQVLTDDLFVDWAYVGFDFTFGHRGLGKAEDLRTLGQQCGFDVCVLDPVMLSGRQVSSTLIRRLVEKGAVKQAARLLQRPYRLRGEVIRGAQRGSTLGFPTANLTYCSHKVQPKAGVYQLQVHAPDEGLRSAMAVGHTGGSPTFAPECTPRNRLEVHIINFRGRLYRAELTCDFLQWIRPNFRFDSQKELAQQIKRDIEAVMNSDAYPQQIRAEAVDSRSQ